MKTENGQADIKVQQQDNQLQDYINASRNLMDLLAEYSGYSMKTNSSAQKTSTESTTQFSNSLETTNFKRRYIGEQFKDAVIISFLLMGIDLEKQDKFRFEFNKNIALEQAQIIDNYIKKIQIGAAVVPNVISDLEGVSDQQADKI
jgi:hypothetical protein